MGSVIDEKKEIRDFSCYTHRDCETYEGQVVSVAVRSEDIEMTKKFFKENIRSVEIPVNREMVVGHGGYGRVTRFDITQHRYGGGGYPGCGGFIEVLEIKNPPDGKHGIVIHEHKHDSEGVHSVFCEFETLEDACSIFDKRNFTLCFTGVSLKGLMRKVDCGHFSPWFYAVLYQAISGDIVYPYTEDDPIYRPGKKFIVAQYGKAPTIKTCVAMRYVWREILDGASSWKTKREKEKTVIFSDGTVWEEFHGATKVIPLSEKELWIELAMDEFQKMLAGQKTAFEIPFENGGKFIGRYIPPKIKGRKQDPEGKYDIEILLENGEKKEGYHVFRPTVECPTVESMIRKRAPYRDQIKEINIERRRREREEKKWAGVIPDPYEQKE